jgi:hypothetical protein
MGASARTQQDAATDDAQTERADASTVRDAPLDATPDTSSGCEISQGFTPTLDGTGDVAAYPSTQHVSLGAMLGSDAAAIAWDATNLYATLSSSAFTNAYEPLHLYLETGATLATATPSTGKEYGGLVAQLPFTPTHLIAVRRVSDSGTGPYNGVFVPGDGWTQRTIALDAATLVSSDHTTISVTVPWSSLGGCPTHARIALHVVHGVASNEWKDLVPPTHTPWQAPGGGYYEIDLRGAPAVTGWSLR